MLFCQDSHNAMEICSCNLSREIHKQDDAPTEFIEDFEDSLGRTLTAEWFIVSQKAVKTAIKAFKGQSSEREVKRVERALNKEMGKYGSDKLIKTVEDQLEIFYTEVTTRFINEFNLSVTKATKTDIGISFNQQDINAIEATQRITTQSAGRFFPDQVSGKTSEVIREVVLESGLSSKEAAIKLQAELEGALGVKEAAEVVPARFATNPQNYFKVVSSNASVQATSVGRLVAMNDAGVEKYRIEAIIDKRTSNICRSLNGREFSVQKNMRSVVDFFAVSTLKDLENLMPFNNTDTVPKWADNGLGFPPYHHACRTTVIPTGF